MTDQLALDLVRKGLLTDQLVLHIGYDSTGIPADYDGKVELNYYGKIVPKSTHGSINLGRFTSSAKLLTAAAVRLYDQIVDPLLSVRRINVICNHAVAEETVAADDTPVQYGLFDDVEALERQRQRENIRLQKERSLQEALLRLKYRYGKNAVLKGMNVLAGATAIERNGQVGGHRA